MEINVIAPLLFIIINNVERMFRRRCEHQRRQTEDIVSRYNVRCFRDEIL